ncbi:alpha/beta hydrolase [Actinophytocola sp. KF-1]
MPGGRLVRGAVAGVVAVVLGLAGASDGHAAPGPHPVASVRYTLGDTAFRVPGFHSLDPETGEPGDVAGLELTAVVHYPRDLRGGPYPLVVLSHGMWETCADRAAGRTWTDASYRLYGPDPVQDPAERARLAATATRAGAALNRWPCAPGTPPMPSYRGYDYLGRALARAGIVAVSISANGVNAGELGQAADMARAALINEHLRMWRDLSATGGGALAGRFTALDSGRAVAVDFTGRIDLRRVGTLGHSRGGRGVMWHASDNHRGDWPAGVTVRAAVPLAPAEYYAPDPEAPENLDYRVTGLPFAAVTGSCDYSVGGGRDYVDNARGRTTAPLYLWQVHGANHNFLNSQWSPRSGQVLAHDDVQQTYDYSGEPRPRPGHCDAEDGGVDAQLTETGQRLVTTTYVTAFFRRHLLGDTSADPVLTGQRHPLAHITTVDVETVLPR